MPLAAKKNGVPTVIIGSASGRNISGGENANNVDIDFCELVVDVQLDQNVFPFNCPPGQMTYRGVPAPGVSSPFYAYYGWGDGNYNYWNAATGTYFYTYDPSVTIVNCRLLTNGFVYYTNGLGDAGSGKVIEVNRWGEKTQFAGTQNHFVAGGAVPVTINPADNIPTSFRSVYAMFTAAVNLNWNGFNNWDWANTSIVSLTSFLNSCQSFSQSIDIDFSNIITLENAFTGLTSYTGLGMEGWDVSLVESMNASFKDMTLINPDLSNWSVSSLLDGNSAFADCSSFEGIGVSNWDVSNANDLGNMFSVCTSFVGDISGWTFKNNADIREIIKVCPAFSDAQVAATLVGWDNNPNQGTGVIAIQWCVLSGNTQRVLSEATYPNAKIAYDNLKASVSSGGKGWVLALDISWTP